MWRGMRSSWLADSLVVLLTVVGYSACWIDGSSAKTYVIPHVLEKSGTIANTQFTFDTTMFATYTGGLMDGGGSGGSATVDIYLFDQNTGLPMTGAGGPVANPYSFVLDANQRKQSVRIDDLIVNAGGFGGNSQKTGYAVVVVGGDEDAVALQGFVVNSHTSPFDLAGTFTRPILWDDAGGSSQRTFVVPHVLETSGKVTNTQNTFDTTIFATYTPGLAGVGAASSATVDVHLFDRATDQLLVSGTGTDVCAPCTFALSDATRKHTLAVDDAIGAAGGFASGAVSGFGVVNVSGNEPRGVSLAGFVVNSHTSAFDLSVFGFEPQPIQAPAAMADPNPGDDPPKTFVIPHVLEKSGRISDTQFTFDTTIFATYAGGLAGTPAASADVQLFLYDQSGALMLGQGGTPVANGTHFVLNDSNRSEAIRLDDLIASAGGFDVATKTGYAVLRVTGDTDTVSLAGEVANAHTGPLDLSVFDPSTQLVEGGGGGGGGAVRKTFVIPHILEKSGRISDTQFTFDTTVFATYTGGLFEGSPGSATIELSLFDDQGNLMRSATADPVADGLDFVLDGQNRHLAINLEDLIDQAGGFDTAVKLGFGVVVVGGDASNVNLQGFVVNSHTSPFDLSVFSFTPVLVGSADVPEPSTLLLAAAAAIGGFWAVRRRSARSL